MVLRNPLYELRKLLSGVGSVKNADSVGWVERILPERCHAKTT